MNNKTKYLILSSLVTTLAFSPWIAHAKVGTKNGSADNVTSGLSLKGIDSRNIPNTKSSTETNLYIITLDGPIQEEWKEELENAEVTVGDYIPENSFLIKIPNSKVKKEIQKLSFVKKITPFHTSYKLDPTLANQMQNNKEVKVVIIGFSQDNRKLSRIVKDFSNNVETLMKGRAVVTSVNGKEIKKLILSDDIVWIEPVSETIVFNDEASKIINSDELKGIGYTGKGQVVGVSDSGLDTGNLSTLHPDIKDNVKKLVRVTAPWLPPNSDLSDLTGHGTHVVGSVLGTGSASNGKYQGMAPEAKLVFQAAGRGDTGSLDLGDSYTLWKDAYSMGAKINSASWGSLDYGVYSAYHSRAADQFMWDHKDAILLVAAGNDQGVGFRTVTSPGTAKNVITVGASTKAYKMDDMKFDVDRVSFFSSLGPTGDGRIKPDIVAPGTHILSTKSTLASVNRFEGTEGEYYGYMSGTSMATPVLAGGVAQIREYLDDKQHKNPSGALIKGMLLTGTDRLYQWESSDAPEYESQYERYGRANLLNSIKTDFIDQSKGMKTGDSVSYTIKVDNSNKPFKTTLTWTDYPSSNLVLKNLVNDLDLKIKSPSGKEYFGNFGNNIGELFDEESKYRNEADHTNNVEQIFIPNPEKGTYTVTILGFNVPEGPQPYALVTNSKFTDKDEQLIKSLKANKTKLIMKPQAEEQITINATYSDGTIRDVTKEAKWTTSKSSVVSVENGKLIAKTNGKATVKATVQNKSINIMVTVQ
ncbi:UNVERIFIED_CONTAM: serine protease AprX [Brevibacillus sp. OAP136]